MATKTMWVKPQYVSGSAYSNINNIIDADLTNYATASSGNGNKDLNFRLFDFSALPKDAEINKITFHLYPKSGTAKALSGYLTYSTCPFDSACILSVRKYTNGQFVDNGDTTTNKGQFYMTADEDHLYYSAVNGDAKYGNWNIEDLTKPFDPDNYTGIGIYCRLKQGYGTPYLAFHYAELGITYTAPDSSIYNGSSNITSAYLGSTPINAIYLGSNKLL